MAKNIEVPTLGESVTEAILLKWLKSDGEFVNTGDAVAELETDKANVDLPAQASGLLRQAKEPGETVQVGEIIGRIDEGGGPQVPAPKTIGATAAVRTPPAPLPQSGVKDNGAAERKPAKASAKPSVAPDDLRPSVRALVAENRLDPSTITGTGPGGQITKEDVQAALPPRTPEVAPAPIPPSASLKTVTAQPAPIAVQSATAQPLPAAPPPTTSIAFDADGTKRIPMSKLRRRIAQNLIQAQQSAAILTTFNEVDLTALLDLRAKYKERFNEVHGVPLGLMSFFSRASVLSLREFPRVNAFLEGDDIIYHEYVHLGIAVSTDRGLAVPVLRHVEKMSFARIESEIKRVAAATREGKLGLQELSGGTFTITNGGVFGSLLSTPILNPPQSGILGMHAIQKRPMVVNDKVEIRSMMYVALSYDHRLVDGKESVSFLVRLKQYLEDPARLMLEI